jgi:hypothetical protein
MKKKNEIKYSKNFKVTKSDNAIPIEELIKREFIQYVNQIKGYTYIKAKEKDEY